MAKYPRVGRVDSFEGFRPCACCEIGALKLIHWQFDYMRGNDEVYAACPRHLHLARNNQNQYFADLRAKLKIEEKVTA